MHMAAVFTTIQPAYLQVPLEVWGPPVDYKQSLHSKLIKRITYSGDADSIS